MSFIGREGPELFEPEFDVLGFPTLVLGLGLADVEGTLGLEPAPEEEGLLGDVRVDAGELLARATGGFDPPEGTLGFAG
tara:strand:- start:494 stop:730 length:237 start_codon:yes stop_codon:yes gene_type:complete